MLSQFDKAKGYCTEAAQKPYEGDVTSNNLGVFRALQGNMTAAHDDFARAAGSECEDDCSAPTVDGAEIASSVARRNIKKLEEEGYASVASEPVQKVAAQNRQ